MRARRYLPARPAIGRPEGAHGRTHHRDAEDVAEGAAHLAAIEPRFAAALELTGPLPLRRRADGFETLLSAIVSQQVSTAAADRDLEPARGDRRHRARRRLLAATDEALRAGGLSRQKIAYGRAIAAQRPRLRGAARHARRRGRRRADPRSRASASGPPRSTRCSASAAPTSSPPATWRCRTPPRQLFELGGAPDREGAARHEPRLVALAGGCGAAALGLLPRR